MTVTPTTPATSTTAAPVVDQDTVTAQDLEEIQGIILRGYKMEVARHFVLRILNPTTFKQFLGKLVPNAAGSGPLTVTTAAPFPDDAPRPDYFLNIGLSWAGIQALKLRNVTFATPSDFMAFKDGATNRATQAADTGTNAPANWMPPFAPANASNAHAILSLYAHDTDSLDKYTTQLRTMFAGAAQTLAFDNATDFFDAAALPNDTIHFGYVDGISQPRVQGMDHAPDQQRVVPAWGAVLRDSGPAPYVMPEPEVLTRNSGFGAFRILEQDAHGFDTYIKSQPGVDPELLAAKMCGRWRNGNPLALCPVTAGAPLPTDQLSDFNYVSDPKGDITPIGSHARRGNPRDSEDVVPIQPFNRVIRRGMPYGPAYQGVADNVPRGLVGWFIGASLENQFEFIQRAWLMGQNFASNVTQPAGVDPLFGGGDPAKNTFDYPPSGHVSGFQQFITTKGGMYCFLPSMPALTWMSQQA